MAKNNKWIFIGIGAVILLAVLLLPTKTKDKDFLEVRFYDANGNLVGSTENFATQNFAVVCQGTSCSLPGIAQISFVVNAQNLATSAVNLDFTLKTLTQSNGGTEFDNAIVQSTITNVLPGASATWTSSKITIPSTWIGTTITFTATVGAKYGTNTLADKTGSIALTFNADPTGNFAVTVGSSNYANVQFRTGSLSYPQSVTTDSWIAYSNADIASFICGNTLVGYGFGSVTKPAAGTCNSGLGTPILTTALPHTSTIHLTTATGDGIWSLHRSAVGFLQVCEDETDGAGYGYIQYSTAGYAATTPAATDTQAITVDTTREVNC